MTRANGVNAHLFENFQLALQRAQVQGRAERPEIVMVADALKLYAFAVEEKAFLDVEFDCANTESRFVAIDQNGVRGSRRSETVVTSYVQIRRSQRSIALGLVEAHRCGR